MDTISAYSMGQAHRNEPLMVFDWHKAARLIGEALKKNPGLDVTAWLSSDYEYTVGDIMSDGKPVTEESDAYLCSTWATPVMEIKGEEIECWIYQNDIPNGEKWDNKTLWPSSALAILNGEKD